MRACYHEDCTKRIGREYYFCPDHRDTEYAFEFRKLNGHRQP